MITPFKVKKKVGKKLKMVGFEPMVTPIIHSNYPDILLWDREKLIYLILGEFRGIFAYTVVDKSQTGCPVLHCKIPILRVGVWPIWVGPAHSPLGKLTLYTSSLTYSKMSCFQWVLLKIQQFEFLRGQFWFILVLSGKLEKCNCLPFQNCTSKIAHFWGC